MSYRRQKRWWNAYILFYEQVGHREALDEEKTVKQLQNISIGRDSSLIDLLYRYNTIVIMNKTSVDGQFLVQSMFTKIWGWCSRNPE